MRSSILAALCFAPASVLADSIPTSIQTGKWTVETSEGIWAGSRHTSYPIWNMLDGRADTAWVFSGLAYPTLSEEERGMGLRNEIYVRLKPDRPVVIDELRLMNGYNKSDDLYFKNSRITEVKIYAEDPWDYPNGDPVLRKPLRTVQLSDAPGMKSIVIPKRKYGELWVLVTGVKKGPVDDLCISEMMPRAGGRDLVALGGVMQYSLGSDCGCSNTGAIYASDGRKLSEFDHSERLFESKSPDKRTLAILDPYQRLVVIDIATGRILARKSVLPATRENGTYVGGMSWVDNRRIRYSVERKNKSREETIRVR